MMSTKTLQAHSCSWVSQIPFKNSRLVSLWNSNNKTHEYRVIICGYDMDMLDKSEKAKNSLCLLSDFHHLGVAEILLHEVELKLLSVDEEGHFFEQLAAKHGVKLNDLFVGATENHSLESSFLHLLVYHSDVMYPMRWLQVFNSVESSPTRVDVFSLFKGLQVHCLDQFLAFSLQITE